MDDEFTSIIETQEREFLKGFSVRLQQVLREMEDNQIKVLALQAEAQYLNYEIQQVLESRRLARLSKEKT
jgi:hypothetical protein